MIASMAVDGLLIIDGTMRTQKAGERSVPSLEKMVNSK